MCISVVYFSGPYLSNCQKLFCCLSYISTDMFGCLFYQLLRKEHQNLPLCWFTVPPGSCVIFPFVDFEAMLLSIMRIEFLYPLKKKNLYHFYHFTVTLLFQMIPLLYQSILPDIRCLILIGLFLNDSFFII